MLANGIATDRGRQTRSSARGTGTVTGDDTAAGRRGAAVARLTSRDATRPFRGAAADTGVCRAVYGSCDAAGAG